MEEEIGKKTCCAEKIYLMCPSYSNSNTSMVSKIINVSEVCKDRSKTFEGDEMPLEV